MTIGFIGLGNQGAPMARAIGEAGWPLLVWTRRAESLMAVADVPHGVCDTVTELGNRCDVVGLCLRDDADVAEILVERGLLDAMGSGSVVANHGTGSPDICLGLVELGCKSGVSVLDAPVSGGSEGARAKTLTMMVGGDATALEKCRPVYESCCPTIAYLGPAGSGQLAKLINNVLFSANLKNVADMVELGSALNLDVGQLIDIILASSGSSYAVDAVAHQLSPELVGHAHGLINKDLDYFADAARARGVAWSRLEESAQEGIECIADAVVRLARYQPSEEGLHDCGRLDGSHFAQAHGEGSEA